MNAKIWFVLSEGQVTGPYDPNEVESKISSLKDVQIWGRGQSEWMNTSKWRQSLQDVGQITGTPQEPESFWKLRIEGKEHPPMKYSEMLAQLRALHDFSIADVCPAESTQWKEIYAVPRIADDLGVTRRSHPRVPIVGTLTCQAPQGNINCRVISISEGGLGINGATGLQIGEQFKATLNSPNLYVTIDATCEVLYVGQDGYAGLRFVYLPEEFKSSIIEYVRKFASV